MQKESACTTKAISEPLFISLTDLSKQEGGFLHSEYPTNHLSTYLIVHEKNYQYSLYLSHSILRIMNIVK